MLTGICYTVPLLLVLFGQVEKAPDGDLEQQQETMGRATLGGTQYWTDHFVCHDWRIQRNVKFGQFRLLRPTNRVAQTGTYESCRQAFDVVWRQPDFPPIPSTLLVRLITPKFEFAIIAGGKSDENGYNPLLSGDDDLIVRVEETKLSGAADFSVIPSIHTYLMDRGESKEMTLRFLQLGFLKSADERKRIP